MAGCRPPAWALVLIIAIVVAAAYLAIQVFGVLMGVVFPDKPPLPAGAVETSHESISYGSDRWRYDVDADPCTLVDFYQSEGATCLIQGDYCESGQFEPLGRSQPEIASCAGKTEFSIFAMRYTVDIGVRFHRDVGEDIYLDVERETLWGGAAPPTSTPAGD